MYYERNDNVSRIPTMVTVCAILHNICEVHGDEFDQEWLTNADDIIHSVDIEREDSAGGAEDTRYALTQYFNNS